MLARQLPESLVGTTLDGKYAIERLLGKGSMGAVYRARQIALERTVAVKVMAADLAQDADFAERFHREAKAASRLGHPNSVGVADFGQAPDGLLYLVMEYVPGQNLDAIIQEQFPLDEARIANILGQVLSAVAAAHDLGIVHRDLKPENILVVPSVDDDGAPTDVVKVCDFGVAKMFGIDDMPASEVVPSPRSGRQLTAFGAVLGTPAYMSPEQAQGLPPEPRSDLYAIGAMLFELLTKRIPFELDSPEELVLAHILQPARDPRALVPACSPVLAAICLRALEKRPDDRYATARAMRGALRQLVAPYAEELMPQSGLPVSATTAGARGTAASLPPHSTSGTPTLPADPGSSSRLLAVDPALGALRSGKRSRGLVAASLAAVGVLAAATVIQLGSRSTSTSTSTSRRDDSPSQEVRSAPALPTAKGAAGSSASADVGELDEAVAPAPAARAGATASSPGARAPAPGVASAPSAGRPQSPNGDATNEPTSMPSRNGSPPQGSAVTGAAVTAPDTRGVAAAPPASDAVTNVAVAPAPLAATTPLVPATLAATAPPPFSPDRATVVVSVGGVTGTSRGMISALVGHISFTDCYRTSLRTLGRAEGGAGSIHLEIDEDGVVQVATVRLPGALSGASACFAGRIQRQRLPRPPDTGSATADLALELAP